MLFAAVLIPDHEGRVTATSRSAIRLARGFAAAWLVADAVDAVLALSQAAGVPVTGIVGQGHVGFYLTNTTDGKTYLFVAVLALLVLLMPTARSSNMAAVALGLALAGLLLPPLLTGHSASAGNHDAALSSLAFHVLGAGLWVGGLAAVGWLALRRGRRSGQPLGVLTYVLPRYSRLALVCFVTVAASGVVNAWIRIGTLHQLTVSRYGQLVIAKTIALLLLGTCGYLHRRLTIRAVAAGERASFLRLGVSELLIMAATIGLAVALSVSPTPIARKEPDASTAKALLGFDMPGPISIARLATE